MSLVQRIELHLVPAILPLSCTGQVALVLSDPHVLFFYSPYYFYCLSVTLTVLALFFWLMGHSSNRCSYAVSNTELDWSQVNWFVLLTLFWCAINIHFKLYPAQNRKYKRKKINNLNSDFFFLFQNLFSLLTLPEILKVSEELCIGNFCLCSISFT